MRCSISARLTAPVMALFLLSSQAQAQQQEITAQEVDAYLRKVQREVTDMMRSQQLERITTWIQDNIADGAVFQASINIFKNNVRKGLAHLSLEKEDLALAGGVFAGSIQKQVIKDYSLEAVASEVVPHGPGAATAKIRWIERLRATVAGSSSGSQQAPESKEITIESLADCNHLLQRMQGRLVIGLSTCTAEVRL